MKIEKRSQSGQMLLVILLVMIVGLTVGLFLIGRTTTDISTTTKITDSTRAFNAAEAGVEQVLRSGTDASGDVSAGVAFNATRVDLTAASGAIYPSIIEAPIGLGNEFTVWLACHDTNGQIYTAGCTNLYPINRSFTVCFNTPASGTIPAVGITFYYRNSAGTVFSATNGYDPSVRQTGFTLTAASPAVCGSSYNAATNISLRDSFSSSALAPGTNNAIALRIRPLFASTAIAVIPEVALPAQGNDIVSIGTVGEITRKISVQAHYKENPVFMDYVLYSTGDGSDLSQ